MVSKRLPIDVDICGVHWKNRVTTASGTFAVQKRSRFYDPSQLGCITTKGVSPEPWPGNAQPRVAETYGGMLNAIGLENPGVDSYLEGDLPQLKRRGAVVMANIVGHAAEEYCAVAEKLAGSAVDLLELNISCPNVKEGGIAFGTDAKTAAALTARVKRAAGEKPVIVKLSPNVTDITEIADAVVDAGADGLSLINTLIGMRIDLKTGEPILANKTGGLSGPAIHPVAVRMVYEVRRKLPRVPIIGMGGVMTGADAYELLLAGADAIAVGTAALADPLAPVRVAAELEAYLSKNE
ncbi:MAG: dihydroorotate dehydrogenase [Clostridiales Family XIII bacterium]|jgi:dihydroorotate dehydrogenase (NAD+) catalytic subunit|nr:dihydroorotate dehydrogenase [Clostridiales Family XIII bacterium]